MSRTGHSRYLKNRAKIRDQDVCWRCGRWIDPAYKSPHPESWSADHVEPYALTGNNNGPLKPAHRGCNSSAGARKPKPPVRHGRNW